MEEIEISINVVTNNFISYIPGGEKTKLVVSVPHGGELRPESIQNRNESPLCKNNGGQYEAVCEADSFTKDLAFLLRKEFIKHSSLAEAPHVIIAEIHRIKVDLNREINEATMNVPEALTVFEEYHRVIDHAKKLVKKGLFIDLHGQSHPEHWVELGYLLPKSCFNTKNLKEDMSSIKNLAKNCSFSFYNLICGEGSLGRFLNDEGIKAVPSPMHPVINGNYFNGGYNTLYHGSKDSGEIDSIQIESPFTLRSKENRSMYACALARSLARYIDLHYKESADRVI